MQPQHTEPQVDKLASLSAGTIAAALLHILLDQHGELTVEADAFWRTVDQMRCRRGVMRPETRPGSTQITFRLVSPN